MRRLWLLALVFVMLPISAESKENPQNVYLNILCRQTEKHIYEPGVLKWVNFYMRESLRLKNSHHLSTAFMQKVYAFSLNICNTDSALFYYNKMVAICPNSSENLFRAKKYLIYGYQDAGKYNLAINECNKILNTSKDKREILEAYLALVELYNQTDNINLAVSYAKKGCVFSATELTSPDIYHYKLALFYTYAGMVLTKGARFKEAALHLQRADSVARHSKPDSPVLSNFTFNFLWYVQANYYLYSRQYVQFRAYIKKLKEENSVDSWRYIYNLLTDYYIRTKQFAKALVAQDSVYSIKRRMKIEPLSVSYWLDRATIYEGLGRKDSALFCYHNYVDLQDTLFQQHDRTAASEFAEILQTNKLRAESEHLKEQVNKSDMRTLYSIIVFAAVIILLFSIWSLRQRKINNKLDKANRKLTEAYDRVEHLNKMKTSFIQNMSHEIRTPLNGIVGFAQLVVQNTKDNDECTQYTHIIEKESKKLLKVVSDVINLSDIESDVISCNATLIHNCCEEAFNKAKAMAEPGIKLSYTPSDKNISIYTNASYLAIVLDNLLDNALKFTKEGCVSLSYENTTNMLHLIVSDTGCGIPNDKKEWVFNRFAKTDNFSQGSGLGLSICQLIVNKMHGSISIDENYAQGCKVDVYLPLTNPVL